MDWVANHAQQKQAQQTLTEVSSPLSRDTTTAHSFGHLVQAKPRCLGYRGKHPPGGIVPSNEMWALELFPLRFAPHPKATD